MREMTDDEKAEHERVTLAMHAEAKCILAKLPKRFMTARETADDTLKRYPRIMTALQEDT